jgi:hypothetical protein
MHPIDIGAIITIIAGAFSILAPIIARAVKASDRVGEIMNSISKNGLVTHDQIDKAVESILSGGKPPTPFVDSIGDIIADLMTRLPGYLQTPKEDRIRLVASVFSKQTKDKVSKLLNTLPDNILSMVWSIRQVVERILTITSIVPDLEAKNAVR